MKKILCLLTALMLAICLLPLSALPAAAQELPAESGIESDYVNSVTVNPPRKRVQRGRTYTFTAEVSGSVSAVRWSVSGQLSTGTTIDANSGKLTVDSHEYAEYLTVKATSTYDSSKYGTAIVTPTDYPVYISSVTVNPSSASVPRGGGMDFTAVVEGTDFGDVTWTLLGGSSEDTYIKQNGALYVGSDEYYDQLTVRATSVMDPTRSGQAIVTVTAERPIGNEVWVSYDTSKVGITTELTGREVTEALLSAIDYTDVAEGTYVYRGASWTCLVKNPEDEGNGYIFDWALGGDDELINTTDEYYYRFNIENLSGYVWDEDRLPSAKVNGEDADFVAWATHDEDGDIFVYKKANIGESSFVSSVSVNPSKQRIKKGNSYTFTAEVAGTETGVSWSISGQHSSGTYINSSTGRLTVGSDEDASPIEVTATSTFDTSKSGTAYAYPVDTDVYVTSVSVSPSSAEVRQGTSFHFTATVVGTDFDDVTWSIIGAHSDYTEMDDAGHLIVYYAEEAASFKVRATSNRNSSKYGEASVTIIPAIPIGDSVWVNYDPSKVSLNTSLTGRQVTEALENAIYYEDMAEGTYVYGGASWTCLVKNPVDDGHGYISDTPLGGSDANINTTDTYYYRFNIENEEGYLWDEDNLPSVTVNGGAADFVGWSSHDMNGDIFVYKRAYLDGTNPYQAQLSPSSIEKTIEQGYGPYAVWEDITVTNTGTEPLVYLNDDDWGLKCSNPLFDLYAGGAPRVIAPGESYTRTLGIENGLGPGVYTTDITFQDVEHKADPVKITATITVVGVIEEVDLVNVPDPYAGRKASDYNYTAAGTDGEGYYISDLQWCRYEEDMGYLVFNGTFEKNETYYLAVELRTDEGYRFARTSTYGLNVRIFTVNGESFSPVFYGTPSEYFNGSDWLRFFIPVEVTKEANINVTPYPASSFSEGTDYYVDGNEVNVKFGLPCKVGYLSGGKYVACELVSASSGWHTFRVPDGVEDVIIVVKGDADLNGQIKNSDATKIKSFLKTGAGLGEAQQFAADADGNGQVRNSDATKVKAYLKGNSSAIEW